MKTIGMLGGMSWESSIEYYRIVNQTVKEKLGGLHSAQCLMYSVDFADIEAMQHAGDWDTAKQIMIKAAKCVQAGGSDFLIICTNTMHKMADAVEAAIQIPLLHIADATATAIKAHGLNKIGLLGTKFTMEEDFYRGRLADKHGLEVIIPNSEDRQTVHRVIYNELVWEKSRQNQRRFSRPSLRNWLLQVQRASSWAVPRLGCWSRPKTAAYHCSIPP